MDKRMDRRGIVIARVCGVGYDRGSVEVEVED